MQIPPSYTSVKDHFDQVILDPSTPLDARNIEKLRAELAAETDFEVFISLLVQVSCLLPILQEDPTPVTSLAVKISEYISFKELQSIDPPIDFLAGLKAPSPPINILTLRLIKKASEAPNYVAAIASSSDLVIALVELWLSTGTTEVAQTAFDVIWSLLEVDYPGSDKVDTTDELGNDKTSGQGLMWRRLFKDRNVYGLLFNICSLETLGQDGQLGSREKTVAQGRLMDLVMKAGSLDWQTISTSHFSDIESSTNSTDLLSFVACQMVDTDDVLLHMTLINFFCEILRIDARGLRQRGAKTAVSGANFSSAPLDFLVSTGLHEKVVNYYLDPSTLDPATATYLLGPIMAYISQYATLYPNHLLQSPQTLRDKLLSRILDSFDIPSAQWAHGPAPSGDLNILASLPRVMLLEAGNRSLNPLLSIPAKPLNKDSLDALGRIFNGPPLRPFTTPHEDDLALDSNPTSPRTEAAAARILYLQYLNEHPSIWSNVVVAADVLAMQDTALAAIELTKNMVTANWTVIPAEDKEQVSATGCFWLPTESQASRLGPSTQGKLPATGAWALLTPPALATVIPYLFKQPQTYANFVAGGAHDTESAVWRVATAKYDALVALQSAVERIGGDAEGIADILRTLKRRVADGPLGQPTQIGSRVDALEL